MLTFGTPTQTQTVHLFIWLVFPAVLSLTPCVRILNKNSTLSTHTCPDFLFLLFSNQGSSRAQKGTTSSEIKKRLYTIIYMYAHKHTLPKFYVSFHGACATLYTSFVSLQGFHKLVVLSSFNGCSIRLVQADQCLNTAWCRQAVISFDWHILRFCDKT